MGAAGEIAGGRRAKVWHDNEGFLVNDKKYKAAGLTSVRFPPNSGDLNPIETVWAKLRKDLAKRVFKDLKNNNVIDESQFKQRAAQILNSYSVPEAGQRHSYLQKLVRGIPARLAKCKKNKFGRCGK